MQRRVLGVGLLEDGNVGVGVFPESEKILVTGPRFGGVSGYRVGATETQVCQRADRLIQDNPRMVENLLEFSSTAVAP